MQSLEISFLKSSVTELASELADLKRGASHASCPTHCEASVETSQHNGEGLSNATPLSYSKVVAMGSSSPHVDRNTVPQSTGTSVRPPIADTKVDDRKFNVVIYGISECEKGMTRMKRLLSDIESVCS